MNLLFFLNSILLGVGLAMDAFSVSLANGLSEPKMRRRKMCIIAGVFAFFQALMPMTGWICVKKIVSRFAVFEKFVPWIALVLLLFIGIKMVIEGAKNDPDDEKTRVGAGGLLVQGIATSIDALSVGFTISEYGFVMALVCSMVIAAVTFVICMAGLYFGRKFGTKFSGRASVLGGLILVLIGIEIWATGIF